VLRQRLLSLGTMHSPVWTRPASWSLNNTERLKYINIQRFIVSIPRCPRRWTARARRSLLFISVFFLFSCPASTPCFCSTGRGFLFTVW
jgi:hypothetical protein